MLINQIQRIGRAAYDNEDVVDILLRLQNPVKSIQSTRNDDQKRLLLVVEAEVVNDNLLCNYSLREYNENDKYHYLLGLTAGNLANYSLTISINYPHKENIKKIGYSTKFDKITRIEKQKIGKRSILSLLADDYPEEAEIIEKIITFLKENEKEINLEFSKLFKEEGYEKFQNPLIFKIKINNQYKYLGEIVAMRELYKYLALGTVDATFQDGSCYLCGANKGLRSGFNLGFFTLDQHSFRNYFFRILQKKFSHQYLMCTDCFLFTQLGFVIIKNRLNFYAYKFDNDNIFHYIIPLETNLRSLKTHIDIISRAKNNRDSLIDQKLTNEIKSIHTQIEQINETIKKEVKTTIIKKLEKQKQEMESKIEKKQERRNSKKNQFTIEELIEQLKKQEKKIPIMDIYYKITDNKSTPKVKEIQSELLISTETIDKLANIFEVANKKLGKSYRPLWALKDYMQFYKFLHYYNSIISLKPINKDNFDSDINHKLKTLFFDSLSGKEAKKQKSSGKKNGGFINLLEIYETYRILYEEANLWR
ncbi:MAG: hypothetical protein ACTSR8_10050 [Promethearchaeota archaeon]